MGKNTPERQDFIIGNLRVEKDLVDLPGDPARTNTGLVAASNGAPQSL
jgi:hypothetical protein